MGRDHIIRDGKITLVTSGIEPWVPTFVIGLSWIDVR